MPAGGCPLDGRVRPRARAGRFALKHVGLNLRKYGRRVAATADFAAVPGSVNQLTARRSTAARSANNKLTVLSARSAHNQLTESVATSSSEATRRSAAREDDGRGVERTCAKGMKRGRMQAHFVSWQRP